MSQKDIGVNMTVRMGTSGSLANAERGVSGLRSSITGLKANLIVVNQTWELMGRVFNAVTAEMERGATAIDVAAFFERQAISVGRSSESMLADLEDASAGALTNVNAMMLSNQAVLAGMDFSSVLTTIEYLRRYSEVTGKSFTQLTNTIMTGLSRGSVLMLDDAGIIIEQTELMANAAAKYGRELTENEKKHLIVAEAIQQMNEKMLMFDTTTRSATSGLAAIRAELGNVRDELSAAAWNTVKTVADDIALAANLGTEEQRIQLLRSKIAEFNAIAEQNRGSIFYTDEALRQNREHINQMLAEIATLQKLVDQKHAVAAADEKLLAMSKRRSVSQSPMISNSYKLNAVDDNYDVDWGMSGEIDRIIAADEAALAKYRVDRSSNIGPFNGTAGADIWNEYQARLNDAVGNSMLQSMVDDWYRVETSIRSASIAMGEFGLGFDDIEGAFGAMEGAFAAVFQNMAKDLSNFRLDSLAASLITSMQMYAAQKTAALLMEAAYQGVMVLADPYNTTGNHAAAASAALSGAAVMGSFVLGSGIAGMAHDGINYVPREGTWLLDAGERVIAPQQNNDLTEFLQSAKSNTGSVTINVTINGGDEAGVVNALPQLEQTILRVVQRDIAVNGSTARMIKEVR